MISEKIGLYNLNIGILTITLTTLLFILLFSMAMSVYAEAINNDRIDNTINNQITLPNNSTPLSNTTLENTLYPDNNIIQLLVIEETNRLYKWFDVASKDINPTLMVIADSKNILRLQNPTEEKHKLIILGSEGNVFAASEDIEPSESGQVYIEPNMPVDTSMEYYCNYHPETMKGAIQVIH